MTTTCFVLGLKEGKNGSINPVLQKAPKIPQNDTLFIYVSLFEPSIKFSDVYLEDPRGKRIVKEEKEEGDFIPTVVVIIIFILLSILVVVGIIFYSKMKNKSGSRDIVRLIVNEKGVGKDDFSDFE